MEKFGLRAVNTFGKEADTCHTRAAWGRAKATGSQIDYLLVSKSLDSASGVFSSRFAKSDHFL
eukprot:9808480-Karenia_brevis.AAC.1